MYKHLFGPVPSRRLGISLGVDLVPHKVCTLNCVYCECGKTTNLTTERREYVDIKAVKSELQDYFSRNPDPDYITFSGAGEPTLNSGFGEILGFIKKIKRDIPLAVLTNGTLLSDPSVRKDMLKADLVLPSLDAAIDKTFRKVNAPSPDLNLNEYLRGMILFSEEFKGKIWLEVFIIPGFNDDEENLSAMKQIIVKMKPDKIQVNTLDRPGTLKSLRPANQAELKQVLKFWDLPEAEIIAAVPERKDIKSYRSDIENAIIETISRRPCTLDDLVRILGIHINEVNKYLGVLEEEGKLKTFEQDRGLFYTTPKEPII